MKSSLSDAVGFYPDVPWLDENQGVCMCEHCLDYAIVIRF